jgi:hypothetical protein
MILYYGSDSKFYSEDGIEFYDKVRALEYKRNSGKQIFLNYHDSLYSSLDWKTEPVESLEQLYREQAQRIRDTYDKVILCYSGGYDSTNILETFHYNNIALDKIVIVGAFSKDRFSGVDDNHNGELYLNAFPYIEELGLSSITQVFDYVELMSDIENFSIIKKYGTDWVYHVGAYYSVNNWFWHDAYNHIVPPEWRDKNIALLMGVDKPVVRYKDGKPIFRFSDTALNSYGGLKRINFYWDPTFPKILLKQLKCVLRSSRDVPKSVSDADMIANKAVYNLKRPLVFKSPKSASAVVSFRDQFLYNAKNSDTFRMYRDGVKKLNTLYPEVIYSKPYELHI